MSDHEKYQQYFSQSREHCGSVQLGSRFVVRKISVIFEQNPVRTWVSKFVAERTDMLGGNGNLSLLNRS